MAPWLPPRPLLLFLFLPFAVRARARGSQPLEVAAAAGGVAFLSPRPPQNPLEYAQIHWRWENQLKIAVRQRGEEPRYFQGRFQGRLQLLENATLKLGPMRSEDGGEFQLHLEDDAGRESVERVLLKVYEPVPKPRVRATTSGDPERCNATLSCSVDLDGVTYEWIPPQRPPGVGGPVLSVSFNPAVETYVCRVSNAVSSSSASLTYRHPCSWTGESSSVDSGAAPGARPALGRLVLLFLLFLLFLLLLTVA